MDNDLTKREKMVASGSYFEKKVASLISTNIDCKIFMNIEFYSNSLHRGTECDLLVITPVKIYCVECKNYKGYISGERFAPSWTFGSSFKTGHVQNPYLLNCKHIRLIRGTFYKNGLKPLHIENVIVVPDRCHIHVADCNVINLSPFIDKLLFEYATFKPIYNVKALENYFNKVKL